jgi:hypothetical protein
MVALSLGENLSISSNTITPTHDVHHIVTSGEIHTITPPSPDFCGVIYLIADTSVSWTNAGNINGGASFGSYPSICIYDNNLGKWFIHANG